MALYNTSVHTSLCVLSEYYREHGDVGFFLSVLIEVSVSFCITVRGFHPLASLYTTHPNNIVHIQV